MGEGEFQWGVSGNGGDVCQVRRVDERSAAEGAVLLRVEEHLEDEVPIAEPPVGFFGFIFEAGCREESWHEVGRRRRFV